MRITILSPRINKIAGGTRILLQYAQALAIQGNSVTVAVIDRSIVRSVLYQWLPLGRPYWIEHFLPRIIRVPRFEADYLPTADVIVCSFWGHAEQIQNLPARYGKKVCFIQHDERMFHGDDARVAAIYRNVAIKKIAVSTWLRDMIQTEFDQSCELLINPYDRMLFRFQPGLRSPEKVRILMLYHNYEWKGAREGVAVVNAVKKNHPTVELVMFGFVPNPPEECAEYYHNPKQSMLASIYSRCDLYVVPAWQEGFGLTAVEAMACNCALVTYDNGGSRDYAFDGVTALVAKNRDMADLQTKIEALVVDQSYRTSIAAAGQHYVQSMPTIATQATALAKFLST